MLTCLHLQNFFVYRLAGCHFSFYKPEICIVTFRKTRRSDVQGEHKVFPRLQTFVTRKLRGIQTFFLPLLKFPTRRCISTLGVHMFVGFWMQHFQTGGLGEMVQHPGHHDRRISPPLTSFYGGYVNPYATNVIYIWSAYS